MMKILSSRTLDCAWRVVESLQVFLTFKRVPAYEILGVVLTAHVMQPAYEMGTMACVHNICAHAHYLCTVNGSIGLLSPLDQNKMERTIQGPRYIISLVHES